MDNVSRDWQVNPSYAYGREAGALSQLIDDDAHILLVGDYAAVLASFLTDAYEAFHLITKDDGSTPDRVDQHYTVSSYDSLPSLDAYDTILVPRLDWPKRRRNLLRSLRDALREDGQIIIETRDESSEHTTVLETLRPGITGSIYTERLQLLEPLTRGFTVERYGLTTSYTFQTKDDFILYFNQHANKEWGEKLSSDQKQRLGDLGESLGYEDLEERGFIFQATR